MPEEAQRVVAIFLGDFLASRSCDALVDRRERASREGPKRLEGDLSFRRILAGEVLRPPLQRFERDLVGASTRERREHEQRAEGR